MNMEDTNNLRKIVLDFIKAGSSVIGEKEDSIYSFLNDYAFLLGAFTSLTLMLRYHVTIDELKSHVSNLTLRYFAVAKYIPEKSHILDIGCGVGYLGKILADKNCNYVGIDSKEKQVTVANEIYRIVGIQDKAKAVAFDISKAERLPYNNEYFDYVIFIWSIHDMNSSVQRAYLEESKRVLKQRGHIYIYERKQISDNTALKELLAEIGFVHEKRITQGVVITHGTKTYAVLDIYRKKGKREHNSFILQ